MTTLVNGQISAHISAADRGLLYGQSVFETIAIVEQVPQLLDLHLARLQRGCDVIGIPFDETLKQTLSAEADQLSENQSKAVLRMTLSMGEGGRGYLNPSEIHANRILSRHPYPEFDHKRWRDGIELGLVSIRLASQTALAGIKHGNRLEQIIARSQWQQDWHEALILDQQDNVIEATQSNVFIVKDGELLTPDLSHCGVAGVMREHVIEQAKKLGVKAQIVSLSVSDIHAAEEVFLSNSVIGIWPVKRFQSHTYDTPELSSKLLNLMIKNEVIPNI